MTVPAVIMAGGVLVGKYVGRQIVDAITKGGGKKSGGLTTAQIMAQQQGTLGITTGGTFAEGADIQIDSQGLPAGTKFEIDPMTGEIRVLKRRKRRKRLLTCGDKSDLAFLVGQLGKGQLAQSAITSLLSKCG